MAEVVNQLDFLHKAALYELLAQHYKYTNPNLHIHYYLKHIKNVKRALNRMYNHTFSTQDSMASWGKIRIVNYHLGVNKIDVDANHFPLVSDFACERISEYFYFPAGRCHLKIFDSENKAKLMAGKEIKIESGKSYTLAVAGTAENIALIAIENHPEVPVGETKIRFFHLSSETSPLDVAVKARDVIFANVSFSHVTEYLGLTPMTVDLELRTAGSKHVVLPMPKLQFTANNAYTLIFWGNGKNLHIIKDS